MGKNVCYVVKPDDKPAVIMADWGSVQKATAGKKGALFKGCTTMTEAEYIVEQSKRLYRADMDASLRDMSGLTSEVVSFSDGTFTEGKLGYGLVIVKGDAVIFSEGKSFSDAECKASERNIVGETHGAMRAMTWCVEQGIKSLDLVYDWNGIGATCTGFYKPNSQSTQALLDCYESIKDKLDVKFIWTPSHQAKDANYGELNKYNDLADQRAAEAVLD